MLISTSFPVRKPAINLGPVNFPTQREKLQESGDLQVVTADAAKIYISTAYAESSQRTIQFNPELKKTIVNLSQLDAPTGAHRREGT
ncbi:MAG: hypothetical protein Q7K57_53200 [Burkholderiaceae bacterium]|nr:hypothetical protein [Burkholderiaceae bacterium]